MKSTYFILAGIVVVVIIVVALWQGGYFGGESGEEPPTQLPSSIEPPFIEPPILIPPPITPTPVAPAPKGEYYEVKKGDTLWKIAKKHYGDGTKYTLIQEANPDLIKDPKVVKPGWKIFLPALEETSTPATLPPKEPPAKIQYHTVVAGDNLEKIAFLYYKDASKSRIIFEANRDKLATPETTLKVGWKLRIPPLPEVKPPLPKEW